MRPQAYLGNDMRSAFMNPSAVDQFKRQFMHLEANPGAVLQGGRGGLPATSAAMHQGAGPTSASASRVPVARPPGGGGSGYLHGGGGSGSFGERGSGGAFAGAGAIAGACAVGSGEYGAAARAAAVHELQRNAGRYLHSQVREGACEGWPWSLCWVLVEVWGGCAPGVADPSLHTRPRC